MNSHRKLAAIMFTDLVGYSALSQRNEALALELLDEHRQLLRPHFTHHNGKEIKTIGDAFLVEFTSAVEATQCAIAIQKALTAHTSTVAPERRIQVRIGLHVGDVVFQADDVLGDGVNIASRIEPLAEPGGICVSAAVAEQIRNKIDGTLEKLGERKLKGIVEPVTVYRIVLPWEGASPGVTPGRGAATSGGWARRGLISAGVVVIAALFWLLGREPSVPATSKITSIAVLPLDNLMGDPDQDYFVNGMHEAIISNLSRIGALKVISRTSTLKYRNPDQRVPEIARELGVGAVVEGSVFRDGNRVRITAQLIDGETDQNLWAQDYEREMKDILALHGDIARAIAREIEAELTAHEEIRLTGKRQIDPEAYEAYLKGYHYWNKRTGRDLEVAKNFFQQAINADPIYAQAYIGLADTYNLMDQYSNVSRDEAFPKAKAAALKALEIDPGLAEAHTSLAYVAQFYAWDFAEAEREYLIALELNPHYDTGLQWYAELLVFQGRFEEAIDRIAAAHELDPLSPIIANVRAWIYYCDEQYMTARLQTERVLDLHPGFPVTTGFLTLQMLAAGQTEEWLDLLAEDHSRYGPTLKQAAELRLIWEQYGMEALILETGLASKTYNAEGSNLYAKSVASIIAQDAEGLLAQLEEGFEARLFSILFLAEADPGVRALLADDPRYRDLLTRMGLD